jgi:hypothetical protein
MPSERTELINTGLPPRRGGSLCIYGVLMRLKDFSIDNSLDFNYNIFATQWPHTKAQDQLYDWMREGSSSPPTSSPTAFPSVRISSALQAVAERKVIETIYSIGIVARRSSEILQ